MKKFKTEALAEAVAHVSGYQIPGSPLYVARNPGGLKAYMGKAANAEGQRLFSSVIDGLQSLIYDTQLKLGGMSRACLQPSDTLQDFAASHGQPTTAADAYAKFLRRALNDDSIHKKLELRYFLDEE